MMEVADKQKLHEKPNIQGDKINILLLSFMYMLQGALYGFTMALPIYFQNRKVSYADQAEFSFVSYPFCVKLLFAPLIDCIFVKKFGRRKTWVIPMQYLMGLTLLFVSMNLDDWLGTEDGTRKPNVRMLALTLFMGVTFSAWQDVALDGWSLTMLQKRNVGYAGTCQNLGGRLGENLTYVLPIVLDSKDLCNLFRSVPQDNGFVSLPKFMMFWSLLFMISTTLILIFKKDDSLEIIDDENCECKLPLKASYKYLWGLAKLRPIIILALILLTFFMGFGPQKAVAHLKMIEAGVPRDKFVLLTVLAFPIQTVLSVVLRRQLFGPRALHAFVDFNTLLLFLGVALGVSLFLSHKVQDSDGALPVWYICFLLLIYNTRMAFNNLMISAMGAFFCRISDPQFGGIYLTFLNTIINIGTFWPQTLSLWCVDALKLQVCDLKVPFLTKNGCVEIDGFFTETVIFTVIGALWLCCSRKYIYKLENVDSSQWIVDTRSTGIIEEEKIPVN